jgi:hypothetical protein
MLRLRGRILREFYLFVTFPVGMGFLMVRRAANGVG